MDPTRFDAIAKLVATDRSRPRLLRSLAGAAGGLLAARGGNAFAARRPPPRRHRCLRSGEGCAPDLGDEGNPGCCSGVCCEGTCCGRGSTCCQERVATGCCSAGETCTVLTGGGAAIVGCCPAGSKRLGEACVAAEECCGDLPVMGCVDGTCCATNATTCRANADCCSGSCMPTVINGIQTGICACMPDGGACTFAHECCSGACVHGACLSPCRPVGASCSPAARCCAGSMCVRGTCRPFEPPPGS